MTNNYDFLFVIPLAFCFYAGKLRYTVCESGKYAMIWKGVHVRRGCNEQIKYLFLSKLVDL